MLVPTAQLIRFQDPAPTTWSLDDTAWLVAAPAECWQETVTALRTIDDRERKELGCRVVAAAADTLDREDQPSSTTRSRQEQPLLLPVAVQLGSTTAHPEYPLPADDLQPLAQAAGLTVRTSGRRASTIAEIVNDLVKISWNQARNRMRSALLPGGVLSTETAQANDTIRQLEDLRRRGAETTSQLSSEASIVASLALDVLISQVAEECTGNSNIRLAGEMFDQHEHLTWSPSQSPHLWEALTQLNLAGLYGNEL